MSDAAITTRTAEGGVPMIAVAGDIDMAVAPALDAAVQACLAEQPDRLIFDLTSVSFIDSAGLNVLILAARSAGVELRDPSSSVRRLLQLSGLEQAFAVVTTTDNTESLPDMLGDVEDSQGEPDTSG